ncbi:MAG: hypothetical protein PVJ63_09725 [Thioalkalispiraceae bacterium]|jgi:hypothetical protein
MKIEPALQSGIAGIQKGLDDARQASHEIATLNSSAENENPTEVVHPLMELKQAEVQVAASAEAVKTQDEIIGTLLDELA